MCDIAAAKKIHRVKADFVKTDFYLGIGYKKENVINTQNVDLHRRQRKLLSQPMSESSLRTMEPQIEEKVRLAIEKMGEEMKSRQAVDIYKWWMFMTTDIIGQLTFGEPFYMLENGKVGKHVDIRGCIVLKKAGQYVYQGHPVDWGYFEHRNYASRLVARHLPVSIQLR